jgi:1,2-phenylacetyl-CoA epoxidase catalytic subunit
VPRMLEEEAFHAEFADGRVRELVGLRDGRRRLQARVDAALPEMLCWFGQPGERGVELLRGQGLLARGSQELRQAYLDRVGPPLEEAGVELGTQRDRTTRGWDDGNLPWQRWNPLQRRLEPAGR